MNIAHLYAAPRTLQISDLPDELATIIWFLRFLHADRKGYFCINAGIADDQAVTGILMLLPNDDHPNITSTRKWFYYDPERPDLLQQAASYALALEATYGNVYTARCLFRSKSAKQDYTYASPIIFLDDAPHTSPIPYTLYMDTGTGSGQAYLRIVKPPTKADSIRVKQALNCDPTGSAENKLVRLPCTAIPKPSTAATIRYKLIPLRMQPIVLNSCTPFSLPLKEHQA